MDKSIEFLPNWTSNPGSTITDILEEQSISISNFASQMQSSVEQIEKLITGVLPIDFNIANKLERTLGVTSEFWINRENQYREGLDRIQKLEENWIKDLPIKEMIKNGWINKTDNLIKESLNFFNVTNIFEWEKKYNHDINHFAFRTSTSFESEFGALTTWLRRGEIVTNHLKCNPWNLDLFIETLEKIKPLTKKKNPKDFLPKLIEECSNCGVAVGIVQTPLGCRASGATKFISKDRALLLLSFRYLSDDQFWFTFFHEAGHLVLHNNKSIHIESTEKNSQINIEEEEANTFAAEMLIPYSLHSKLKSIRSNKRNLINVAMEAGVSPGIVVGQMQYLGIIDFKYLNSYKRRYNWDDINEISSL